ncbi:MAG: diacylglycerol kinase family lipid kinase [Ignavibacteriaceae bacterium]|nr:diacylglycerol kinase family lipid kinase [Ignavibacteriaceae bacterium]
MIPDVFQKVILIINPASGKGTRKNIISEAVNKVRIVYPECECYYTSKSGDARQFADKLKETPGLLFIVLGGDGTINEVINGLGEKSKVIFTVLPIGSGNDFCKTAGYSRDIDQLIERISNPVIRPIDSGLLQFTSKSQQFSLNRYFVSSSGLGFDGLVAKISNRKSILKGILLYLSSVIVALGRFKPVEIEALIDEETIRGKKFLVSLGNGKTSGGGFLLTPEAELDDGLLDVCIADDISNFRVFTLLPKAINGSHIREKEIYYAKFSKMELKIKTGFIIHYDGEVMECEPGILKVENKYKVLKILR